MFNNYNVENLYNYRILCFICYTADINIWSCFRSNLYRIWITKLRDSNLSRISVCCLYRCTTSVWLVTCLAENTECCSASNIWLDLWFSLSKVTLWKATKLCAQIFLSFIEPIIHNVAVFLTISSCLFVVWTLRAVGLCWARHWWFSDYQSMSMKAWTAGGQRARNCWSTVNPQPCALEPSVIQMKGIEHFSVCSGLGHDGFCWSRQIILVGRTVA